MSRVEKSTSFSKRANSQRKPLEKIRENCEPRDDKKDAKLTRKNDRKATSGKENVQIGNPSEKPDQQLLQVKTRDPDGDGSFVDATLFFELINGHKTIRVRKKSEEPKRVEPPRKKNSLRKVREKERKKDLEQVYFANCLYDMVYHKDNLEHMFETEDRSVLRYSFLKKSCDEKSRMAIVHWFTEALEVLKTVPGTIFIAVQLFDKVLVEIRPIPKEYGILAVTCVWLAQKSYSTKSFDVLPKLVGPSYNYTMKDIKDKERDILKIIGFSMSFPEPATFLYYFMEMEDILENGKIRCGAMLLLECYTFFMEFSTTSMSILAATSLFISMEIQEVDTKQFLLMVDSMFFPEFRLKKYAFFLYEKCLQLLDECGSYAEHFKRKYATEDNYNVIRYFLTSD